MKVTWPLCITTWTFATLAQLFMPIALAQSPDTVAALEVQARELEKTQQRQLEEMKRLRKATAAPDKRLRDIEKRIADRDVTQLLFTPSTSATSAMRAYYERLVARLEDCGTRHTPKRGAKSVYGKGVVSIGLDHGGNAVTVKIERSSADELIDKHMLKLIAASTPFGPTPERVRPQDERRYDRLVVITSFEFKRDTEPVRPVDASERCRL